MPCRRLHLVQRRAAIQSEGNEGMAGGVGRDVPPDARRLDSTQHDLPDGFLGEWLLALFSYIIIGGFSAPCFDHPAEEGRAAFLFPKRLCRLRQASR